MSKVELELRMSGNAFNENDGYNLYLLSKGLGNFNSLLEKSYLTITSKQRMSVRDREIMKVKAFDIRTGSFVADVTINLLHTIPALLPIVTSQSPESIWNLTKEGILFLKAVLKENAKGRSFMTEVDNESGKVNIFNNEGDVVINNIHPDTFLYVEKAERNIENIARLISPESGFDGLSIKEKNDSKSKFWLKVEDKMLFEQKVKLEKEPVTFYGELYNVDGDEFRGKVRVLEGTNEINSGEYNFEFLLKDREILKNSFLTRKRITALKETEFNPVTLKKKITRLRIIDTE